MNVLDDDEGTGWVKEKNYIYIYTNMQQKCSRDFKHFSTSTNVK